MNERLVFCVRFIELEMKRLKWIHFGHYCGDSLERGRLKRRGKKPSIRAVFLFTADLLDCVAIEISDRGRGREAERKRERYKNCCYGHSERMYCKRNAKV